MHLDVALNPAEIALLPQRDLSATTCVVFDVLRATSSMITGLAHGAAEIHPVCTIEEALALKERMPHAVLGGERHGELIPGFDVGNAPHEYASLGGRAIITTTTNGTVALRACEQARRVLVGALLNLDALASALRREAPQRVLLVCAGTFADFALEDAYAAGALIARLDSPHLSDAAHAALAVARQFSTPLDALRAATNGVVLAQKGRGGEVEWCARVSVFNVVGQMQSAVIRPLVE
jgi:2-phosphosulfolactate phosphatase